MPAQFGKRLQELREKAGMTQTQLAESTGIPLGSIRNYEQGHRDPLWQAIFKLAEALGVDCSAFKDSIDAPAAAAPSPKGKRVAGQDDAPRTTKRSGARAKPAKKRKEP